MVWSFNWCFFFFSSGGIKNATLFLEMCENPSVSWKACVCLVYSCVCVCVSLSLQTAVCRTQVGQLGGFGCRANSHTSESGSEGWPPQGSLLNPGEPTAEGWLMAKWPSRWTSTAPTPRRPSHTTTSTRAASNLHTCTCKSVTCHQRANSPRATSQSRRNIYFELVLAHLC